MASVVVVSSLGGCLSGNDPDPQLANTETGLVRGAETSTGYKFLGIPYAAPPVGAQRWKAPAAAATWAGERDATKFGNHCPQGATFYGTASNTEDCLYLNVYRPKGDGPFPVVVWIHGGAFFLGESDGYDPSRLVAKGTVVVTLNYRLGVLGFLAHPALSAEQGGASGNYGLMDQQAALRWVKANIANFGGNPGNVTIAGQSAGGFSVMSHMVSPGSAGLFHKAIIQSGAYPFAMGQDTLAQAQAKGSNVAKAAGCTDQSLACLRAAPLASVLAGQAAVYPQGLAPHVDTKVLPMDAKKALTDGTYNKVPVMTGSTHDEWRLFVGQTELLTGAPLTAATYVPGIVAALSFPTEVATQMATGVYPLSAYPSASLALGAMGTDVVFACSGRQAARLLAARGTVYTYEFADGTAPQFLPGTLSFPSGASHNSELQYLVTTRTTLSAAQQALSDTMVGYWTEFARSGNPNAAGTSTWPAYTAAGDQYLSLAPGAVAVTTKFAADHKCAIWTPSP
ncbi:MAG: carboxylesterase family protein [Burkholderiales bacterium]|nr:carboxylesterase family protein [Burkholderiales bacterium]